MKISRYNFFFDHSDGVLAYNAIKNGFALLYPETYQQLQNFKLTGHLDIPPDTLKELTYGGFVVEDRFDELQFLRLTHQMRKFSTSALTLTIMPTLDCNLRCAYCFQRRSNSRMEKTVADQLVAFVEEHCASQKFPVLSVSWYGGEPLLEKGVIRELSRQFIQIAEKHHMEYGASIVTNGTMVDDETASFLEECKIQDLQITLDGYRDIHDKRRPYHDGSGSFDSIVASIKRLGPSIRTNVRINVDKQNHETCLQMFDDKEFLSLFTGDGKCYAYIGFVRACTSNCQGYRDECYEPNEFWRLEFELLQQMRARGIPVTMYPSVPGNCAATTFMSFVVGPAGELYKCWNSVGDSAEVVGTIFEPVSMDHPQIRWMSLELGDEECLQCKFQPLCAGGCPDVQLKRKEGQLDISKDCARWKFSLENSLLEFYQHHKLEKQKEECHA